MKDNPKLNVVCSLCKQKVFGPFFFANSTETSVVYIDMLSNTMQRLLKSQVSTEMDWQVRVNHVATSIT
jgi:hypothetical protein